MAAKIVNPRFPDLDHDLRFLHTNYPMAYDVDRTAGTHAISASGASAANSSALYCRMARYGGRFWSTSFFTSLAESRSALLEEPRAAEWTG